MREEPSEQGGYGWERKSEMSRARLRQAVSARPAKDLRYYSGGSEEDSEEQKQCRV